MVEPAYYIERLTEPEAYLITLHTVFDPATDMQTYFEELSARLDEETAPITSIVDIRDLTFTFTDLLGTTRDLQNMKVNPTRHRMSKKFIVVSESKLMKASMDGFRRFGIFRDAQIVLTVEDALRVINEDDSNGTATRLA
ncbi:MAG: hypothetical protein AAF126_20645 [Chloroflexota bacterium]